MKHTTPSLGKAAIIPRLRIPWFLWCCFVALADLNEQRCSSCIDTPKKLWMNLVDLLHLLVAN